MCSALLSSYDYNPQAMMDINLKLWTKIILFPIKLVCKCIVLQQETIV